MTITRPGVEVIQTRSTATPVSSTAALVPVVLGVCKQIVEVLDADGALNADALYSGSSYEQADLLIPQSAFPDPRDNIDDLNIDEGTVRCFLNFGGQVTEIPRGSASSYGTSFLANAGQYHACPMILSTVAGPIDFSSGGPYALVLALDVTNPANTSSDVTVNFPSSSLTLTQVAAEINDAVGADVAGVYTEPVSNPYSGSGLSAGDERLYIRSTRYGARASVTLRAGANALRKLFGSSFDHSKAYRVEGAGFRGQDDNDNDLTTPWVELYAGDYKTETTGTWSSASFPADHASNSVWAVLLPKTSEFNDFANAKVYTSIDFTDQSGSLPLRAATSGRPGDQLWADGTRTQNAEIVKLEPTRFKLGTLNTAKSTFDADGNATTRIYDTVEVNVITHPSPFSPTYGWFLADGLVFPANNTPVAATLTGSESATAAVSAFVQGSAVVSFPLTLAGLTLLITSTVDGVAGDSTTVTFAGGPYANIAALVAGANTALASAGLDEEITAVNQGNWFGFQSVATGVGQSIAVAATGTANSLLQFSTSTVTTGTGRDAKFGEAATVTGEPISLPWAWLTNKTFGLTVVDDVGEHTISATIDVSSASTLGALRTAISTAFGGGSNGKIYDGLRHIATLTTSDDAVAAGTMTFTTVDVGSDVTISIVAEGVADIGRYLGFHDDDGDDWAEIVSSSNVTFPASLSGETLTITYGPGSVSLTAALGSPEAAATSAAALAALLNNTAALHTSGGNRLVLYVGDAGSAGKLRVRTFAGGTGVSLQATISGGSAGETLNLPGTLTAGLANGENSDDTGADGLAGTTLSFALDANPFQYDVDFVTNSLTDAVDEINAAVGGASDIATVAGTRQLKLTSALLGAASKVEVIDSTAITALGLSATSDLGEGRPYPNFYLDSVGAAHVGSQILRDKLTGLPYSLASASASVYLQYMALRKDVTSQATTNPSVLTFSDATTLEAALSPLTPDNPLGFGLLLALGASPTNDVVGLGIDEANDAAPYGTLDGWIRALGFLEGEDVYVLAPLQDDPTINSLIVAHVAAMSTPENRSERFAILWQPPQDRAVSASMGSGTNGRSNGSDNSLTLDVNTAPNLIAAGIDVSDIAYDDGVYLEALITEDGSTRRVRYNVSAVSGVVATFRVSFASDENVDGFFTTTTLDGAAGYTGLDWTMYVRGAELLIAGTSLPDTAAQAAAAAAEGQVINSSRAMLLYGESLDIPVDGITQNVPAFYAAPIIAGLTAELVSSVPLSQIALPGVSAVYGTSHFSQGQRDTIATGGRVVLENQGGAVILRNGITTDVSSVESKEFSIVRSLDWMARGLRTANREYTRQRAITPGLLTSISLATQGFLSYAVDNYGAAATARLSNILQDTEDPTVVLASVDVTPLYPCNTIRITLAL